MPNRFVAPIGVVITGAFSRCLACLAGNFGIGKTILCAFIGLALGSASNWAAETLLTAKTLVRFADASEAAVELSRKDTFVESFSPFDRLARKKTDQPVSQEEFLKFVSEQALFWQSEERDKLIRIIGSISNKIDRLHLKLPASIQLVKTTGQDEGGAAYCRGNNIIVPAKLAGAPERALESLLTHELFHILSRNNRKLRDSLYAVVGFKPCGPIAYPKELVSRKITNPDAPVSEHYITVTVQEKSITAVPILFSSDEKYDLQKGGEFFAYLTFKLLAIEQRDNHWVPVYQQSKPRLLEVEEVQGFHEQVGRNTDYIIHPEEVLADNFVLLVHGGKDIPTPRVISEMRRILSAASE